jgi:hypothetical protein
MRGIRTGVTEKSRLNTHVRPCDQIVCRFIHTLDNRMFHNFIRQIQAARILNQGPARLATRSIPPHDDIILEIGDEAGSSVASLDCNSFEKEVHGVGESFLRSWGAFGYEASPVTKQRGEWLDGLIRSPGPQTFSSISRHESWARTYRDGGRWS